MYVMHEMYIMYVLYKMYVMYILYQINVMNLELICKKFFYICMCIYQMYYH